MTVERVFTERDLAAAFGKHLDAVRAGRGLPAAVCVRSREAVPEHLVALPHLVALEAGDTVVWEALDPELLPRWLPGATPAAVDELTALLPDLLRLRRALRAGDGDEELRTLVGDGYLSTRLALANLDAVRRAIAGLGADSYAAAYAAHSLSLRGVVRHELVARQLREHLPPPPASVVDVGGGHGEQAIRLARAGYDVVLVDPSEAMLERARARLGAEPRVRVERAAGEELASLGLPLVDAVLLHAVLPYADDARRLVASTLAQLRPGGVFSVLVKNRDALALRPGLEGRFRDALAAFGASEEVNRLGVHTRAHSLADVESLLGDDARIAAWYGVRVFTDHLGDTRPPDDLEPVLAAELEAGRTDPYRRLARLLHVVAVRR